MTASQATMTWIAVAYLLTVATVGPANAAQPDPTIRLSRLPAFQQAGPVETSINAVIICSGYTADQLTTFRIHATLVASLLLDPTPPAPLLRTSPLVRYRASMNLFGVFLPSLETGTSDELTLERRDTVLFCTRISAAPDEFRGKISCDRQAAVAYARVSPVDPLKYSSSTVIIALVNSPHRGGDRQGNVIFLSSAYLQERMLNSTRNVLLRTMSKVLFSLGDEHAYGDESLFDPDVAEDALSGTPNCFDPRSPAGLPWSSAVFEQKLDPRLVSLALAPVPPGDTFLKLDDVPSAGCIFADALRPTGRCTMRKRRVATAVDVDQLQSAGTFGIAADDTQLFLTPAERALLVFRESSYFERIAGVTDDLHDVTPPFCFACMQHSTGAMLRGLRERAGAVTLPSALDDEPFPLLPRCPLPREIYFALVDEDIHLHINKHVVPANGFASEWHLLLDPVTSEPNAEPPAANASSASPHLFLGANVTTLVVPAVIILEQTKRSVGQVRVSVRDFWIGGMMGPSAQRSFLGDRMLQPFQEFSTVFDIQISGAETDLRGWRVRQCDNSLHDVSRSSGGNVHRYRRFCEVNNEAACSYNYTGGSLLDNIPGFRITPWIAVILFSALSVLVGPWVFLGYRRYRRKLGIKNRKYAYMRAPLRRSIVVLRWLVLTTSALMFVVAWALWATGVKTYVVTQTITSVILFLTLVVAVCINTFALLPAYGALLRAWIPLVIAAVLVAASAIALIVTAGQLKDAVADPESENTAVSVTLRAGWRNLVRNSPSAACSFQSQMSCSGWTSNCLRAGDASLDCPEACPANLEKRTPCAEIVRALISARVDAIVAILQGTAGVLIVGALCYLVLAKLLYDMRRDVHEATLPPDVKAARERQAEQKEKRKAEDKERRKRRRRMRDLESRAMFDAEAARELEELEAIEREDTLWMGDLKARSSLVETSSKLPEHVRKLQRAGAKAVGRVRDDSTSHSTTSPSTRSSSDRAVLDERFEEMARSADDDGLGKALLGDGGAGGWDDGPASVDDLQSPWWRGRGLVTPQRGGVTRVPITTRASPLRRPRLTSSTQDADDDDL